MRFDWLTFALFVVLLALVPRPVTQPQWAAFVVAVVLLVLMALALLGVLGGLR